MSAVDIKDTSVSFLRGEDGNLEESRITRWQGIGKVDLAAHEKDINLESFRIEPAIWSQLTPLAVQCKILSCAVAGNPGFLDESNRHSKKRPNPGHRM